MSMIDKILGNQWQQHTLWLALRERDIEIARLVGYRTHYDSQREGYKLLNPGGSVCLAYGDTEPQCWERAILPYVDAIPHYTQDIRAAMSLPTPDGWMFVLKHCADYQERGLKAEYQAIYIPNDSYKAFSEYGHQPEIAICKAWIRLTHQLKGAKS